MSAPTNAAEPRFSAQLNLQDIHMPLAWDTPSGPSGTANPPVPRSGRASVHLCIIDSGVQLAHLELARAGNSSADQPADRPAIEVGTPRLTAGEGARATACAGIAAAEWGAQPGIVGIAPRISLHSYALPTPLGSADLVAAIEGTKTLKTASGDPWVILISGQLGVYNAAQQAAITTAINHALAANIPVCIGVGEADSEAVSSSLGFPANVPGVIPVGAVRSSGLRIRNEPRASGTNVALSTNWWSAYDAAVPFLVAPGLSISTTDLLAANGYVTSGAGSDYVTDFSGTAAAAAHVAGLAALLLSHNADLTAEDIHLLLRRTAEKVGGYTYVPAADPEGVTAEVGYGRIHAVSAVAAANKSKVKVEVTLNGSGTSVNLVDVVFISAGLSTTAATIRLSHDNPNVASPVQYNLPAAPANFIWDPATPGNPITVPRGGHVDVNLLYQPPSASHVFSGNIVITTLQDHWTPSVTVSVSANAVAPPIVQTVMVLDRSGSMAATAGGYSSRSEAVVDAADLFITLLGDDDSLGIVRFDDSHAFPADRLIQMTVAGPMGSRAPLRNALTTGNPLAPSGSTSIAGGMQLGMQVLENLTNPDNRKRAMLVMTDGHHNTTPNYPAAQADIAAATHGVPRVFALGVGLDVIDSEFNAIVSLTNGYAYQTGTVVTDTKVQELFSKILRDVVDADFADDPPVVVLPGQSQATSVNVGDTDYQVDFIILFGSKPPPSRKRALIALEAPDGTVIEASDIVAGTVMNMTGESRPSHIVLRCRMPAFADPERHLGTWKVIVKNGGKVEGIANDKEQDDVVHCTLMAMVKSNLRLKGHLVQSSQLPGQAFDIVAEPTLYGAPVKLASDPVARVTRPDGVVRLVPLTRNASGAYVGTATDTGLTGVYEVDVEGVAVSPAGITLRRFLRLQASFRLPGQGGGGSNDGETPEGGSRPERGRPSLWCRFWCRFFCLDCRGRRRRCC